MRISWCRLHQFLCLPGTRNRGGTDLHDELDLKNTLGAHKEVAEGAEEEGAEDHKRLQTSSSLFSLVDMRRSVSACYRKACLHCVCV